MGKAFERLQAASNEAIAAAKEGMTAEDPDETL